MHTPRKMIKGISAVNPVDVEREYLLYTVDYAISHGFDHYQLIGPIHDPVKGNIDGMTLSKKYAQFNGEKNAEYVAYCMEHVNEALARLNAAGVKAYMWHHELELPTDFGKAFPEALNDYGDIEVTHPAVKDYLENKINDFFDAYPGMDGIILTLHETKVPLLKLKNQKLDKIGRVKYVTEILYSTCKARGKELIVRPFASIEEDYEMMTRAYEEISRDLVIMDKWTQFDWSLCLPDNKFYSKIKNNPLFVEGDIFGEFFGKGKLPLMLREHITSKFNYCEKFKPVGYVARIDRAGLDPFGEVNEVNLIIMHAVLNGDDVDEKIDGFFRERYGEAAETVRAIMEETESILKRVIYLRGYYYSQLSFFPKLNHSKNHFYFEMMRDECNIASNEWFIPIGWQRGSLEGVMEEKESAVRDSERLLASLEAVKDKMPASEYENIHTKFRNLELVAKIWKSLTDAFYGYAKYFEKCDECYREYLLRAVEKLREYNEIGKAELGDKFYCISGDSLAGGGRYELVEMFCTEILETFEIEDKWARKLADEGLYDYVIAGGCTEGHKLQKEVNFSDTMIADGRLARVPGNARRGWSAINAHGWFSYEVAVRPRCENEIVIAVGGDDGFDLALTVGDERCEIREDSGEVREITVKYTAGKEGAVRVRFDKISPRTPKIYTVKVK